MSDIDILETVLAKDLELIATVGPEQLSRPTPCPEFDVNALVNHIVGGAVVFAAGANGHKSDLDMFTYTSSDPAAEFRTAADELVAGWRAHGTDRTVSLMGGGMPGEAVLGMTLMEYLTHGCDLALATGQAVPFSDIEIDTTFERAKATLPDMYRGAGKPFGDKVDLPADAALLDRFLGFMGRRSESPS